MTPKYLPVTIAVLCIASLAAACTLSIWSPANADKAWEAFLAFAGTLLGIHIPAPSQTTSAIVLPNPTEGVVSK